MAEIKDTTKRRQNFKDIAGQRFGRLKVTDQFDVRREGGNRIVVYWLCVCDCGSKLYVTGHSLRRGSTRSCGCFRRERQVSAVTVHGKATSTMYKKWTAMKQRCTNPRSAIYRRYGGRGIKVCSRWLTSFENFYEDMGDPPSASHSIDRIDNDGDYTPENCRWATRKEQMRNTRGNRLITHNGKTQCLTAWAKELGIHPGTLAVRIHRGWPTAKALTRPDASNKHT